MWRLDVGLCRWGEGRNRVCWHAPQEIHRLTVIHQKIHAHQKIHESTAARSMKTVLLANDEFRVDVSVNLGISILGMVRDRGWISAPLHNLASGFVAKKER